MRRSRTALLHCPARTTHLASRRARFCSALISFNCCSFMLLGRGLCWVLCGQSSATEARVGARSEQCVAATATNPRRRRGPLRVNSRRPTAGTGGKQRPRTVRSVAGACALYTRRRYEASASLVAACRQRGGGPRRARVDKVSRHIFTEIDPVECGVKQDSAVAFRCADNDLPRALPRATNA